MKSAFLPDVITAKISDHYPVVHHDILFWNIMMQGAKRLRGGYNNGFGIQEDSKAYQKRMQKVAYVIAMIIWQLPHISAISICEGPIKTSHSDDVAFFFQCLKHFACMSRFMQQNRFYEGHEDKTKAAWGILLLTDQKYHVKEISCHFFKAFDAEQKLTNRFSLWRMKYNHCKKYIAVGHFPIGKDVHINNKDKLSPIAQSYCKLANNLLNRYTNKRFALCADFNFNPLLVGQWQDRFADSVPINNSLMLEEDNQQGFMRKSATVDGILLSRLEKQRYVGLFTKLILKNVLSNAGIPSEYKKENKIRKK